MSEPEAGQERLRGRVGLDDDGAPVDQDNRVRHIGEERIRHAARRGGTAGFRSHAPAAVPAGDGDGAEGDGHDGAAEKPAVQKVARGRHRDDDGAGKKRALQGCAARGVPSAAFDGGFDVALAHRPSGIVFGRDLEIVDAHDAAVALILLRIS